MESENTSLLYDLTEFIAYSPYSFVIVLPLVVIILYFLKFRCK